MRVFLLFLISTITIIEGFSADIGGALSLDYYNNPIENSIASPIQQRPVLFYNLDISIFNFRAGTAFVTGDYTVDDNGNTTFNEVYPGFYTLEFDLYAFPGIKIDITDSFSIGLSAGGGVRLPILTGEDSELDDSVDVDDAFNWFYSDYRFVFWGGSIFSAIKLPMSETTRLFLSADFKKFVNREDQWTIGATTGLLWHL